jgi:MFS transporter, UMF1 family
MHNTSESGRGTGLLGLLSWCIYDWANSAFPTLVTTFIFSVYFTQRVAADPVEGTALWSVSVVVAAIIVAVGAPILGAIADLLGRRKPWLACFTIITAIFVACLWWIEPSPEFALPGQILYAAAASAFGFATVFYDAMLRDIAPHGQIGRVSGWGWAFGYAGGMVCLLAALGTLVLADPLPFGLDAQHDEHIRATSLLVAVWYIIFSVPLFLFTQDRPASGLSVVEAARSAVTSLRKSLAAVLAHHGLGRFLIAHLLFTNGLNTLFSFGGIYAAGTFGMTFEEVLKFGILLNLTAGTGAVAFAWISDIIGSKRTILIALTALTILGAAIVTTESKSLFVIFGCLLGIFVGPAQAAGRALMAKLAPRELETEAFGLYELAGKTTVFLGPLVLGTVTWLFQSQRMGISTVLLFFMGGILVLLPLIEPKEKVPVTPTV